MAGLAPDEIRTLFAEIVAAITELDTFYSEDPVKPQLGPPATEEQLAALERHWGVPLPPSYRNALAVHNGVSVFWNEVPLLSTDQIVHNQYDTSTFEEPFPKLWKTIFACEDESYDALAFDRARAKPDGEMPIVELSDEGVGERWPNFDVFLKKLLSKLQEEIRSEKADRESLSE